MRSLIPHFRMCWVYFLIFLVWSVQISFTYPTGLVLVVFFHFYFFLSLASKSALALFVKRTFLNFHKNIFPSLFTSLSYAPCTDKGNSEIFSDFKQILVEKTVPYLESLLGLIYEEVFNALVNFIYFG